MATKRVQTTLPHLGRKGSIMDMFVVVGLIVAMAITALLGIFMWGEIDNALPQLSNSSASQNIRGSTSFLVNTGFDGIIVFMFFGISLAVILSAMTVNTHPAFFFISFFMLIVLTILAGLLSNTFESIYSVSQMSGAVDSIPWTKIIVDYLPVFSFAVSMLALLLAYMKSRSGAI